MIQEFLIHILVSIYLKKLKLVQVALHIFMFHICGFNQLWVENTWGKKSPENSWRKMSLLFAADYLFT